MHFILKSHLSSDQSLLGIVSLSADDILLCSLFPSIFIHHSIAFAREIFRVASHRRMRGKPTWTGNPSRNVRLVRLVE